MLFPFLGPWPAEVRCELPRQLFIEQHAHRAGLTPDRSPFVEPETMGGQKASTRLFSAG